MKKLQYLLGRLRETSTWAGLGVVVLALNQKVSPDKVQAVVDIAPIVFGTIAALLSDRPAAPSETPKE